MEVVFNLRGSFETLGESSSSKSWIAVGVVAERGDASPSPPPMCVVVHETPLELNLEGSFVVMSVEESIEKSKCHWSQVVEIDSNGEVAEESNVEVFQTLQSHPNRGSFFRTFGEGKGSHSTLVMGKKFAGGQVEIYEVKVKWYNEAYRGYMQEILIEHVLKVFKKGTFLRHLQSQWPKGTWAARTILGLPLPFRMNSDIVGGLLLEDGRFAFLILKDKEDLRSMINRWLSEACVGEGPFYRREALDTMYEVAFGMYKLHKRGIVHRDIKDSHVLFTHRGACCLANFECSVGVFGSDFFRAPEVLEACKHGNASGSVDLFTEAVNVYAYGMTCYEILIGRLPFEGEHRASYDLVIGGHRLELLSYVDGWIRKPLSRCWLSNPSSRPSSRELLRVLVACSSTCRKCDLDIQNLELSAGLESL